MRLKYSYLNNNSIFNQSGLVKVASPFYEMNGITVTARSAAVIKYDVGIWSLYISNIKQIIHGMKTTEKVKCWNSQTVRKSTESTVNTTQDKNKNCERVRKAHLHKKN